jgi:hypothetical protein
MAVGILGVLTLTGGTLVYYSSANMRSAEFSTENASAYDLAEAGINEMMAVLSKPQNNALNKYLLGYEDGGTVEKTVHDYSSGTVTWWGILDESTATWTLNSVGTIKNPTGATSEITRTLTAKVPVTPTVNQPLNSPAWNYVYSTQVTGGECDMTVDNTVELRTRVYVAGNLCLKQQAKINGGSNVTLVVQGKVTQFQSGNRIGEPSGTGYGPVAEAHVKNGCFYGSTSHNPCVQGYRTAGDELWASTITNNPQTLAKPAADWDGWYLNGSPGPYYPCVTQSGTPPTFDNDQGPASSPDVSKRNLSLTGSFNMIPSSSYSCVTANGSIIWDATSKVLTVSGTIFIDGHIRFEPSTAGQLIQYNGQASIYASGSILVKNVKLCGGVSGSDCDFPAWNPNTQMLTLVSNGSGGQTDVSTGVSIEVKSASFQGALYATNKVQLDTSSRVDGPMVGSEVVLGQSIQTDDFETITTVPVGMPGNPAVYAQPNPPQLYSG